MVKREGSSGRDRETEALLRAVAKAVKPFKAGSLARASLAHLLVYLESNGLSGSLWLYDHGQDSTLQFVRGAPAKVKTTLRVPHLGEMLLELGYIDQRAYDETITFALRGGGLHGAMLVACGLLSQEGLEAGLREQTAWRLIEVFRHVGAKSRFAFYRDVDLLASWGGVELTPVDPWWALWWGTRERKADPTVRVALDLLGDELLVLQPEVEWSRFGFGEAENELLSWWSGQSATVETLLSYRDLPEDQIANLIFVLFLTRSLAYDEAVSTRIRPAPASAERPPMDSVTELLPRPPIEPRIHEQPQASLPDVTVQTGAPSFSGDDGVEMPAPFSGDDDVEMPAPFSSDDDVEMPAPFSSDEDVEMPAPFAGDEDIDVPITTPHAPAYTPPPFPEEIAPIEREPSTRATARMAQAFQTLLDPLEQQSEEEPPPPRGPTYSELDLARSAEAMQLSSRSSAALRQGEIVEAEKLAAKALELLPDNAVLKTDYAWVASLLPARRKIGDMGDLLDMLKEATESDPALDRAYYVRGTIFEYLGMYAKAYAEFRAAFARNAHNAEAAERIQTYVGRIKETGSVEPDGQPRKEKEPVGAVAIPARAGAILSKLWKRS
jgi:tetratricopeptide (TPR) repeat protein